MSCPFLYKARYIKRVKTSCTHGITGTPCIRPLLRKFQALVLMLGEWVWTHYMGQPVWWRENGFGEGGTAEFLRLRPNIPPFISTLGMVFISDGNSGIGAHVQREIGYSIFFCISLRRQHCHIFYHYHFFILTRAQCIMSYLLE